MATLLLADILQALLVDAALNFSTQELNITMVRSKYSLQELRALLLRNQELPPDVLARDDALLLLLTILADAIYLQRSLSCWSTVPDSTNPFVPLSPYSERQRMHLAISTALTRLFTSLTAVDSDIRALYHYTELYLVFPAVTSLVTNVGYPNSAGLTRQNIKVPDRAGKFAWKILDTAAGVSSTTETRLRSPWLPIVVFHAALVIYTEIASSTTGNTPSKRILVPFILELKQMAWPCCTHMSVVLENLMMS